MKSLQSHLGVVCSMGLIAPSAFADITLFMARQGDPPVAAASTIPLPRNGSVCVNFYMSSDVSFDLKLYQFFALSSTASGVSVNCASAQINTSEPRYPGNETTGVVVASCPSEVVEGATTAGTIALTAGTTYYLGEVCYDATYAATGTSTINFDSDPARTFVLDPDMVAAPIANYFGGTIVLGPAIPTLSEWGFAVMILAFLAGGAGILRKRAPHAV